MYTNTKVSQHVFLSIRKEIESTKEAIRVLGTIEPTLFTALTHIVLQRRLAELKEFTKSSYN